MGTFAVDGMVSGLDTTTIISQLMQIEAQPQARLKTSVSDAQKQVSALQGINTRLVTLANAAAKLNDSATWERATASSSSTAVSVSGGEGVLPGTLTFSVSQLAAAKSVATGEFTARDDASSITGFPLEIRRTDGTIVASVSPSDGSLDQVASAINKATNAGVQAAVVQVSPGHYRLQITATSTGTAGEFQITGAGGVPLQSGGSDVAFTTVSEATDAKVHVGPASGGYDVTSSSNTIDGLIPGVTVRLNDVATSVTVTARRDPDATASSVQSFMDAANAVLRAIQDATSVGVAGTDGTRTGQGPLAGSSLLRDLSSRAVSAVSNAVGGSSAGSVGLTVAKDGLLEFDKDVFIEKLKADPAGVRAVFSPDTPSVGVASRMTSVTEAATKSGTGSITLAIDGQNDRIKELNDRIADWDVRLQLRKASLQRTYSALEVSLSQLKSQSSWLAGQLSGLASSSAANRG